MCRRCPPVGVCGFCGYEKRGKRKINVQKEERVKFFAELIAKMQRFNMAKITPDKKIYDESDIELILGTRAVDRIHKEIEEHKAWELACITARRNATRPWSVKSIAEAEELSIPVVLEILKRWGCNV